MIAANTILQNRYRVLRELGHGGMCTVYEALDQRVNCIVALKETMAALHLRRRVLLPSECLNDRHSKIPYLLAAG